VEYQKIKRLFLVSLVLLLGCTSVDSSTIKKQSARIKRDLIESLRSVESLDDLKRASARLKKLHLKLAELVEKSFEVEEDSLANLGDDPEDRQLAEDLKEHLSRVMEYEGARELMVEIQKEARRSLDAFSARQRSSQEL
jgi:hypothetical protein